MSFQRLPRLRLCPIPVGWLLREERITLHPSVYLRVFSIYVSDAKASVYHSYKKTGPQKQKQKPWRKNNKTVGLILSGGEEVKMLHRCW